MQNRSAKIRRNDPCPCASGLKYKKCCLEGKRIEDEELRLRHLQAALKQKIKHRMGQEVVFHEPNSQAIKMSEVILEFAEDILKHSDTRAEKKRAIDFACLAWNLALFKAQSNEEYETHLSLFLKQGQCTFEWVKNTLSWQKSC